MLLDRNCIMSVFYYILHKHKDRLCSVLEHKVTTVLHWLFPPPFFFLPETHPGATRQCSRSVLFKRWKVERMRVVWRSKRGNFWKQIQLNEQKSLNFFSKTSSRLVTSYDDTGKANHCAILSMSCVVLWRITTLPNLFIFIS